MALRALSILLLITLVATGCASQPRSDEVTYMPTGGYVPDEATAIAIAKAIWIPIYGKEKIESEAPFVATLKENAWHVQGTLPKGYRGGTAEAVISKRDGKILRVIHGK